MSGRESECVCVGGPWQIKWHHGPFVFIIKLKHHFFCQLLPRKIQQNVQRKRGTAEDGMVGIVCGGLCKEEGQLVSELSRVSNTQVYSVDGCLAL